ncbi:S8 family serine peptidase [Streptomyces sp. NPDC057136]|uniref:S8 family peptidase n=1 Tax=Streptomyces sp. NPDC057136 TaxID=3346029 RepID=UPI0036450ECB
MSAAVLLGGLPGGVAGAASLDGALGGTFGAVAQGAGGAEAGKAVKTVTLVTGDRVLVDAVGAVTRIERAEGREGMTFSVRKIDGHTHVVPGDAQLLLARGKLDARLFDVTQLVEYGYDDAGRSDLPLIVTFQGQKAPAMSAFSGAGTRLGRALPTVNGKAMRIRKNSGTAFWDTVTGSGGARSTADSAAAQAVEKVWLDGRRTASLDQSVKQIGAPTAWQTGFDGKGVKVAVLDTGVDQTHPDLAGQEIAEKNFSASADNVDRVGHGTHVASTVAGTGAKSGGKYKGVAPGARILDGKVLDDSGSGSDSEIMAGMEWAVAQGADIVNLSLGGFDNPGVDPLEETVNRLSAESDTLFVIASGNEGEYGEKTVGSPGSAESALTVGAVDKSDQLAKFSSRGPRSGDGGVKPDLTAPGVAITAAAAADSTLVRDFPSGIPGYLTISGTSMATPHVAGAAAILAQQHPGWDGERIKAVLTGSTKPGAYSSYQQGTGRTDVARAIGQSVITEQGPIGFGLQQWPHADDKPVTKKLTYRNLGTQPVTLKLSVDALAVDGKPAPQGMFGLSTDQLTVPAGGTATADVTADTRVGTADGSFGGAVTATSADGKVKVRTAVGVEREIESYDLTLTHLDEDGKPTGDAATQVTGFDNDFAGEFSDAEDGTVTVRLPKGDYSISGVIHPAYTSARHAVLMQPKLRLDRDTKVSIDARKAKPVKVTLPDTAAVNTSATVVVGFDRAAGLPGASLQYLVPNFASLRVGQLGAQLPADQAFAQYSGTWRRETKGRPAVNYRLAWDRTGSLGGFTTKVKKEQLAKVAFEAGAPVKGRVAEADAVPATRDGGTAPSFSVPETKLPLRTTDYVLANGIKWTYTMFQLATAEDGSKSWDTLLVARPRTYGAGKNYSERFNTGVFGPMLWASDALPSKGNPGAERHGNVIEAFLPLFGDGSGHWGVSDHTVLESLLRADGKEIPSDFSPTDGTASYAVPAGDSAYELTLDASRAASVSPLSSRVTAKWTFRSAQTSENKSTALPLSTVRFSPELSLSGRAKAAAGRTFDVPFTVEGAAHGRQLKKLAFQVSYDEGRTWKTVKAVDGKRLSLKHPAGARSVSLRAKLTDRAGNTLVQTIQRAYLIGR